MSSVPNQENPYQTPVANAVDQDSTNPQRHPFMSLLIGFVAGAMSGATFGALACATILCTLGFYVTFLNGGVVNDDGSRRALFIVIMAVWGAIAGGVFGGIACSILGAVLTYVASVSSRKLKSLMTTWAMILCGLVGLIGGGIEAWMLIDAQQIGSFST